MSIVGTAIKRLNNIISIQREVNFHDGTTSWNSSIHAMLICFYWLRVKIYPYIGLVKALGKEANTRFISVQSTRIQFYLLMNQMFQRSKKPSTTCDFNRNPVRLVQNTENNIDGISYYAQFLLPYKSYCIMKGGLQSMMI